jgi:ABC-type sugar transport system permease subunit
VLISCLLAPSLLIFLCYRILPLLWNLVISLQDWSPYRPPEWIGFDNYQELLFDDPIFW